MAAIVCQGLQSCLESQLIESRTLRLNFPFSKPHTPQQPIDLPYKTSLWDSNPQAHCEKTHNKTDTTTGWSFLQVLSNVSHGTKEPTEKENAYVSPQAKKSSVLLSQKSLELCTEKLGNETGSDIVENNDDGIEELLCASPTREQTRPRHGLGGGKTRTQNFPPPLTTIRGSESLRMRSHREDGRLVIEAFRVPPSDSCFRAERSHGRLRLCFLKNTNFDSEDEEKELTNDNEGVEDECDCESDENKEIKEVGEGEEEEGTEEEGEDGEREEREDACDGEMRIEKYERPRRCNEGGDHENNEMLINRGKPLCMAIS